MKLLAKIFGVIITLAVIASLFAFIKLSSKINASEDVILEIPQNSGIDDAIAQLNQKEILSPQWFYELVAKGYAYETKLHIYAGVHKFSKDLTCGELIAALFSGKNLLTRHITFPEGIKLQRFASILHYQLNVDSTAFIKLCHDKQFIHSLGLNTSTLEGYLFPATYDFFVDIKMEKIVTTLVNEQKRIWRKYEADGKRIGYDFHKTLTLASIIEAETPVISERKRISGVYHNRIKHGMLLQADPTVQYALGEQKKRLLYSDLEVDSPYNTYKYKGLPPTPINSPSETSIDAAVHPESNPYLFFVATGDGTNSHTFSRTYAEHLKVKNKRK
ncbi:MAG: endolytic transglycosylase MltG [Ignavibacteria bacterium]|jgi:UPF0755 protein|nr:endolytic transglycosylase MltG [Ignavibacteria bacterium]